MPGSHASLDSPVPLMWLDVLCVRVCVQDGATALHVACSGGSVRIVKWLLSIGADVNARSNNGDQGIHLAAWVRRGPHLRRSCVVHTPPPAAPSHPCPACVPVHVAHVDCAEGP